MFDSIKIVSKGVDTKSVKFFTLDDKEIQGVHSCDIKMRVNNIVTATLDIYPEDVDVKAHPILSEETLKRLAEYYGYTLVPKLNKKD